MTVIAYLRVSTDDQTTENQRLAIESRYTVKKWFVEEAVSGSIPAARRPSFSALLTYVREGDVVVVTAIDRLGRDTVDVLTTVETLRAKDVSVISMREGFDLNTPVGKLMLTLLAGVAELERQNIKERQMAGIERLRAEGKPLGRIKTIDDLSVVQWRQENAASIKQTAEQFGISVASVKRACSVGREPRLSMSTPNE
jgi:DNA invertase Pin-like site-specific DNA recombinase